MVLTSCHHLINDAISVPCYPNTWFDVVKIIMIQYALLQELSLCVSDFFMVLVLFTCTSEMNVYRIPVAIANIKTFEYV
jgi:hypothetical protein